jgi:hypothetical protein
LTGIKEWDLSYLFEIQADRVIGAIALADTGARAGAASGRFFDVVTDSRGKSCGTSYAGFVDRRGIEINLGHDHGAIRSLGYRDLRRNWRLVFFVEHDAGGGTRLANTLDDLRIELHVLERVDDRIERKMPRGSCGTEESVELGGS